MLGETTGDANPPLCAPAADSLSPECRPTFLTVTSTQTTTLRSRAIRTLVIGDVLALLAFGVVGRLTHNLSASDVAGVLETTLPFLAGWFVVAPWFGLFKPDVARSAGNVATRSLLAWVPLGFPISVVLWALVRRRAIPDGIVPEFVAAALAATVLLIVGWRLAYAFTHRAGRTDEGSARRG
jgi:hypothetical protein